MMGLARNVVIHGRVRGRKPFEDVLRYLRPWAKDLVSTTNVIRVGEHKHFTSVTSRFTSPISFDICCTLAQQGLFVRHLGGRGFSVILVTCRLSCVPSLTSAVTFSTWAITICNSSCIRLSSFFKASSISVLPSSFLANNSERT